MKNIIIKTSKRKLAMLSLGSLIFVVICILFILYPNKFTSFLFRSEKIVELVGYIGGIFFGIIGYFIIYKLLFNNEPGLIISERGIFDNSSAVPLGWIEWDNITDIKIHKMTINTTFKNSVNFVLINVNDLERFTENKNFLIKFLLKQNNNLYNMPIGISSNGLNCSFEDLSKLIFDSWAEYKSSSV